MAWEERDQSNIAMKRLQELAEEQQVAVDNEFTLRCLIYDCLIDREWWGRLWVVQELVLAKSDPLIMCGSSSLPWSIFMKGYFAIGMDNAHTSEDLNRGAERLSQCSQLNGLREYHQSKINSKYIGTICLAAILNYTKDFHATDPRDTIYGALGLMTSKTREKLKPDYQKPVELVFLETSKYILENDHRHSFFSKFSVSRSRSKLSRASPSWVPDFSAQKTLSFDNPDALTCSPNVKIAMSRKTRDNVSFRDNKRVLVLTGVLFDTIEVAVELKNDQGMLLRQISAVTRLIRLVVDKRGLPGDRLSCAAAPFKKYEDIFDVLTAGRNYGLKYQYDALTVHAEVHPITTETDCQDLLWLAKHFLPGRCFFVTQMGLFGVAVEKVRENDCVTFLFGDRLPIILRPRGLSYNMVCAANVPNVNDDEVTGYLYKKGLVEKRTFLIR